MDTVSLFSGGLGLDLGLERLGARAVCYVENDPACLRLIRHHRPDVAVVEDVHAFDASDFESVGLVSGGFPCQDLSYAGRGAGLEGARSGLFFEMLRIIVDVQPKMALIENVPGLLTRGIVVVLHELAKAGYVGHWFSLGAVDVGAPHRRERVFIVAHQDGGHGDRLAGGHPSGLFAPDGWISPQETLFDPELLGRLGKQGRWTLEAVYEDDQRIAIEDGDDEADTLLPTPSAYESTPTAEFVDELREVGVDPKHRLYLPGRKWHAQRTLSRIAPLLPTPTAEDGERGRNGAGTDRLGAATFEPLLPTPTAQDAANTAGPSQHERNSEPLNVVAAKLLPTPTAGDGKAAGSRNLEGSKAHAGVSLTDAVQTGDSSTPRRLLPTPVANPDNPGAGGELRAALEHGPGRRNGTGIDTMGRPNDGRPSKLLPTPSANDGTGAEGETREARQANGTGGPALRDLPHLLPTPQAADGERTSEQGVRHYAGGGDNPTLLGAARRAQELLPTPQAADGAGGRVETTAAENGWKRPSGAKAAKPLGTVVRLDWGVYAEAITRWEQTLGRPAPAPTDEKGRLSPEFVEWMMGYPDGWTGLVKRTARLRILGNSVQVQVAETVASALAELALLMA